MPEWLTQLLDALPGNQLALYFSLFFVAVACGGIVFIRPFFRVWLRRQGGLNEIVTFASAGFSLFYGLLLGLLSVAAYNNAQDIDNAVAREAGAINTMYRSAIAYPDPTRSELQYLLRDYTLYIVNRDFPAHQRGMVPQGGNNRLQVIRETLYGFEPTTITQQIAHGNVLRDFNDLVGYRQARIAGVGAKIPGVMWYTVAIGAIINIILLLLLDVRFLLHLFIGFLLSFFLGVMIFLVFVLDRPMRGDGAVTQAAYVAVYDQVMAWDDGP